ncbi:MAG: serine/threonine-protein kinase [Polyangiaceae bacterium]
MELQSGDRVDRFTLEELLGEGGQGSVWRATDPLDASSPRALKLIPLALARGSALERARREAHALSRLEHPSLVACDGLFEDLKRGMMGLVMGFVKGTSLLSAQSDPRFSDAHAAAVLRHLANALAYLHGRGIVHRDIKFENVLIAESFYEQPDEAKHVVLVDLGIAIDTDPGTRLTREGGLVGTLSYLAPEALDPANFQGSTASPCVDVFAWGVLAARLLTGRHPTGLALSSTPFVFAEAYRKAKEGAALPVASVDGAWGTLLQDALSVDTKTRIADGTELALRVRDAAPPHRRLEAPEVAATVQAEPGAQPAHTAQDSAAYGQARSVVEPEAPPVGKESSGSLTKAMLLVTGLVIAGGGALYLANATWNGTPNRQPQPEPTAPTLVPSARPVAPPSAAPEPLQPRAQLLPGCTALCDCCSSGNDCGDAGCDATLAPETRVMLRLASVEHAKGVAWPATVTGRVCMTTSSDSAIPTAAPPPEWTCFPVRRTDDEAEGGGLETKVSTLATGQVRIAVQQRMDVDATAEVWSPMSDGVVKLGGPLQGAAFCRGVEPLPLDGAIQVPIGRLRLFVDSPDAPAPKRCPATEANP